MIFISFLRFYGPFTQFCSISFSQSSMSGGDRTGVFVGRSLLVPSFGWLRISLLVCRPLNSPQPLNAVSFRSIHPGLSTPADHADCDAPRSTSFMCDVLEAHDVISAVTRLSLRCPSSSSTSLSCLTSPLKVNLDCRLMRWDMHPLVCVCVCALNPILLLLLLLLLFHPYPSLWIYTYLISRR